MREKRSQIKNYKKDLHVTFLFMFYRDPEWNMPYIDAVEKLQRPGRESTL